MARDTPAPEGRPLLDHGRGRSLIAQISNRAKKQCKTPCRTAAGRLNCCCGGAALTVKRYIPVGLNHFRELALISPGFGYATPTCTPPGSRMRQPHGRCGPATFATQRCTTRTGLLSVLRIVIGADMPKAATQAPWSPQTGSDSSAPVSAPCLAATRTGIIRGVSRGSWENRGGGGNPSPRGRLHRHLHPHFTQCELHTPKTTPLDTHRDQHGQETPVGNGAPDATAFCDMNHNNIATKTPAQTGNPAGGSRLNNDMRMQLGHNKTSLSL